MYKRQTFTVTVYMKLRDGDDQDLTPLEGLRVLVADDEQTAAESACEVLKSIGMEPDYVLSGDDAVDAAVSYTHLDVYKRQI